MRTSLHNPFMPVMGLSDAVAYQQLGEADGRADNTNGITSELRGAGRGEYLTFIYDGKEYGSKTHAENAMRAAQNAMNAVDGGPRLSVDPNDPDHPRRPPEIPDPVPPTTPLVDDTDDFVPPEISIDPVPPTTPLVDDTFSVLPPTLTEEDAYADTQKKLDEAEAAYSGLQKTYTTTMEEMGKLQTDFDSLFSDYSALGTDKSSLQGTYNDMMGQYTSLEDTLTTTREQMAEKNRLYTETAASLSGLQDDFTGLRDDYTGLQGNYTGLQDDFTGLQGDFTGLQGSFDNLQTDYGLTSEQLAKSLEDAAGLRRSRQDTQTQNFLQGAEADKMRRMATGTGGIGSLAPARAEYTRAMDALPQTALNPMSYNMAPIDFTGGMDNNIFTPTQFSAPGADAAAGYTDIFSGPGMGLTQYGYDYGSNFNPYFDALNEQYGIPTAGVKQ